MFPPVQKMQAFLEGCKLEYCEGKKAGFGMDKRTGEKFKKVGGTCCSLLHHLRRRPANAAAEDA